MSWERRIVYRTSHYGGGSALCGSGDDDYMSACHDRQVREKDRLKAELAEEKEKRRRCEEERDECRDSCRSRRRVRERITEIRICR